ncbi:MAG: hypothetical protein J6Y03_00410 [Alphaproteobacteria bacterium]|nr:hypothetical protein [Alphaproteobacteria bacterium]
MIDEEWLFSPSNEYKDCSNAQAIYRKMLEKGNYLVDTIEGSDAVLSNMKKLFGSRLYRKIYAALKIQQKRKISEIKSKKPAFLFHASTRRLDVLLPKIPPTNASQFATFRDRPILCAADNFGKVEVYLFRDLYKTDGKRGVTMISNVVKKGMPDGKQKVVVSSNFCQKGYLYKLPSQSFVPVVRLDGYFDNEWVSFKEVKPVKVEEKTFEEVEEKSKLLYFVFYNLKVEKDFLKNVFNWKKKLETEGYSVVEELIKEEKLIPAKSVLNVLKNFLEKKKEKLPINRKGNEGR